MHGISRYCTTSYFRGHVNLYQYCMSYLLTLGIVVQSMKTIPKKKCPTKYDDITVFKCSMSRIAELKAFSTYTLINKSKTVWK